MFSAPAATLRAALLAATQANSPASPVGAFLQSFAAPDADFPGGQRGMKGTLPPAAAPTPTPEPWFLRRNYSPSLRVLHPQHPFKNHTAGHRQQRGACPAPYAWHSFWRTCPFSRSHFPGLTPPRRALLPWHPRQP